MSSFDGRQDGYIDGVRRNVPGLDGLHRMTWLLLAERVPVDGRVLVVGAGGGLELQALAEQECGWTFDGVDPSSDMLALARRTASSNLERINVHQGDISAAPDGPFDGAVCSLVFHHISPEDRRKALEGIRRRLRPDAPFILAHVSIPSTEPERSIWIGRHVEFGATADMNTDRRASAKAGMRAKTFIRAPEQDLEDLRAAGFKESTQFFQAMSFRGWVSYA
ncbi:class I SAM-dependent methyltransferase [Rhizobium sp. CC-YZS058]|uniref:class I SAM-dependent methyltransferase n=1 Tax=Rhizobium sp. CC-YZS058 TaxID=3042153 RepID=UPI002B05DF65|nr:class I SAM-dependent methyltransferase [Rhizobium sp. CC-YZS058]MEA3536987.1 class I SAM-dependent methyltransferase [Rhizobium sp. CC-YZS058]